MAAIGPDFKKQFVDRSPVSNADIAPTFARILGLHLDSVGNLKGRVINEALAGGPPLEPEPFESKTAVSDDAASRKKTILMYQQMGDRLYFDQACFKGPADGYPKNKCS
jgi:arylsulfatase A-like enzyme